MPDAVYGMRHQVLSPPNTVLGMPYSVFGVQNNVYQILYTRIFYFDWQDFGPTFRTIDFASRRFNSDFPIPYLGNLARSKFENR